MEEDSAANQRSAFSLSFILSVYMSNGFELGNPLHQTVFRNLTGNALFRAYFDFRPHGTIFGKLFLRSLYTLEIYIHFFVNQQTENSSPTYFSNIWESNWDIYSESGEKTLLNNFTTL